MKKILFFGRSKQELLITEITGSKGYTIVEVLVSSLLLSLIVASALGMYIQIAYTTQIVRQRTDATSLAWSQIERARNQDFENIEELAEPSPGTIINESGLNDENGNFRRVTVINTTTNGLVEKRIRVEVLPRNIRNKTFSGQPEILETIISDVPLMEDAG